MTEAQKELVEAVAIALSKADPDERGLPKGVTMAEFYRRLARSAITVVLEEAARVAEDAAPVCQDMEATKIAERCDDIAAAIRAMKGKP